MIDDVRPRTPTGRFPAKAVAGRELRVTADVFRDGHDILAARVRWRVASSSKWHTAPMTFVENDGWEAVIVPNGLGRHELVVEAWTDRVETWRHHLTAKRQAGQDVGVELEEGARLLEGLASQVPRRAQSALRDAATAMRETERPLAERVSAGLDPKVAELAAGLPGDDLTASAPHPLWVDRERALVGAWYELFPRSEGGFEGAVKRLRAVAEMGFDVVYLPPIHPIGRTHRKGRNNTLEAQPGDPGSPWAIGSEEGGHTVIDADLGSFDDFDRLVAEAQGLGMEIALDYALQCSPDHPWVREHPEWFHRRPDGSIKYAENPPKKYEDIYPINFWPDDDADRRALWQACKDVLDFWIGRGVRIFRVDNPHTKPFAFWEWLIPSVQDEHPDLILLSESFTRPKVMAKLAEVGFTQSYTYFTWRTTKAELIEYATEVCLGPKADFMRPNFWPNTPDILSGPLRNGPPAAFKQRLLLAATMVPSYGMYGGYELCENLPASDTNEEYLWSEKYEIKRRDWSRPESLAPWIALVNDIRRRHPAFGELSNISFHHSDNDSILAYSKQTADNSDVVLVVVNLDPFDIQADVLWVDLGALGLPWDRPFEAHDELTGATYAWAGPHAFVRLDPAVEPGHVLHLRPLS